MARDVDQTIDQWFASSEALNAQGSMTVLMKEALKPNLVQSLEHTPTLVHGGRLRPSAAVLVGTARALKYSLNSRALPGGLLGRHVRDRAEHGTRGRARRVRSHGALH